MKILLVSNGYPPKDKGGVEEYIHSITNILTKDNQVCVFTKEYNQGKRNFEKRILKDGNATIVSIVNNNVSPHNFTGSYINKRIDDIFRDTIQWFKPDIIHFNHLLGLSSNLPTIAKKNKIPLLFTFHDYWYICPCIRLVTLSGEICHGNNPNCVKDYFQQNPRFLSIIFEKSPLIFKKLIPASILNDIRSALSNIKIPSKKRSSDYLSFSELVKRRKIHLKKILNTSDIFIAPSEYVKERYTDFGINNKKIILLPHGINLKTIRHNLRKKKNRKIRFAYLGAITEYKGLHIIIMAFNVINNADIELKIYGDTSVNPSYYRRLKGLSNKSNIHFMGAYNRSNLNKIFSSVDVVVIPSIFPESFNLVAHEAQTAGIPVIASKIGALTEIISHKNNGLLFNPGNAEELTKMMNTLIDNPFLISKFSYNSKTPLDIGSHVLKLLNIYKTIVKNTIQ